MAWPFTFRLLWLLWWLALNEDWGMTVIHWTWQTIFCTFPGLNLGYPSVGSDCTGKMILDPFNDLCFLSERNNYCALSCGFIPGDLDLFFKPWPWNVMLEASYAVSSDSFRMIVHKLICHEDSAIHWSVAHSLMVAGGIVIFVVVTHSTHTIAIWLHNSTSKQLISMQHIHLPSLRQTNVKPLQWMDDTSRVCPNNGSRQGGGDLSYDDEAALRWEQWHQGRNKDQFGDETNRPIINQSVSNHQPSLINLHQPHRQPSTTPDTAGSSYSRNLLAGGVGGWSRELPAATAAANGRCGGPAMDQVVLGVVAVPGSCHQLYQGFGPMAIHGYMCYN